MNEVKFDKIERYNSGILVHLGENRNIKTVKIAFDRAVCGVLTIRHAQNNILSEPVDFGTCELNGESEAEISVPTAVSASHIIVIPPTEDTKIRDVCVYDTDETDFTKCYPLFKDLELSENFYLDTVTVHLPAEGYSLYSIYTSVDGRDFELLVRKQDDKRCDPNTGDVYAAGGREARFIRVYIEYNSVSALGVINGIEFTGQASGTPLREYVLPDIPDFESSRYNIEITEDDVFGELFGIAERRLGGEYADWFEFELKENPTEGHDYDYFEISAIGGRVHICGNNGVSLAAGLNHYLKYFCRVNISQVGDTVKMPEKPVLPNEKVFRETKARVRYAYNYCTLSYSMAFWGEKEWRDELDWLALNGVNAVLDATAQEEVWRRFLGGLGYTHKEIKKYIAGPAYYAWAYMANLFGYGGPVHDSWFEKRTELARKNQLVMRKLGMQPILQGYSGMVPPDIREHDARAQVIPQGTWCSFTRPYMLDTTSETFKEYAERFYAAQKEVYGDCSKYFATDPFHEGGITAGLSPRKISKEVLTAMMKANDRAVWIIQSWQNNPTSELLAGIEDVKDGREHALVLDLYAEKDPNYGKGGENSENYGYRDEFNKTPWIFCMLNNFGGRLGLHGHLDNIANWVPEVFNSCEKVAGIGITPEASGNNPVLYDFLFECVWQNDASKPLNKINLSEWLHEYSIRRYGAESENAKAAWDIFAQTVYKADKNGLGQGAPESVLNARPSFSVNAASTWGNSVISYDMAEFETAARKLFTDYELLKDSEGYIYDLVTVVQQVLSNRAIRIYADMTKSFKDGDCEKFEEYSHEFLKIAEDMESVLSCSKYYMFGRWVEQAKALADGDDDFTKNLYEFNAKALVMTWGPYNQAESGQLHDYSNRQWSGLIGDFYKKRWERFVKNRTAQLKNEPYEEDINWFEWEWRQTLKNTAYPIKPNVLKAEVIREILG